MNNYVNGVFVNSGTNSAASYASGSAGIYFRLGSNIYIPDNAENISVFVSYIAPSSPFYKTSISLDGFSGASYLRFMVNDTPSSYYNTQYSSLSGFELPISSFNNIDLSSYFHAGNNVLDYIFLNSVIFNGSSTFTGTSWTRPNDPNFGSVNFIVSYDIPSISVPSPDVSSPIVYSYNLSSQNNGKFSYYNIDTFGSKSYMFSSPIFYDVDYKFNLPDDISNVNGYILFSPNTSTGVKSSFLNLSPNYDFGSIFNFNLNGNVSQYYSAQSRYSINNGFGYFTNYNSIDITGLLKSGENVLSSFSFNGFYNYQNFNNSWSFNGSSFGNVYLYISFDNETLFPPGTVKPELIPDFSSLDHIYFIDTGLKVSDLGSFSNTVAGRLLDGVFVIYSNSSVDWSSESYSTIYVHYINGEIIYTNNQYLYANAPVLQPFGFDYSSYFNNLSSSIYDISKNIYNLFYSLNSLENTVSDGFDSVNDNLTNANGANDSLNQSNTEVDSALQDYKDKTDTSAQYDNIDDSFFDFDNSVFNQYVTTLTFFSSCVTLLWSSLSEFSSALSIFLVICLISTIIGIYRFVSGGD